MKMYNIVMVVVLFVSCKSPLYLNGGECAAADLASAVSFASYEAHDREVTTLVEGAKSGELALQRLLGKRIDKAFLALWGKVKSVEVTKRLHFRGVSFYQLKVEPKEGEVVWFVVAVTPTPVAAAGVFAVEVKQGEIEEEEDEN